MTGCVSSRRKTVCARVISKGGKSRLFAILWQKEEGLLPFCGDGKKNMKEGDRLSFEKEKQFEARERGEEKVNAYRSLIKKGKGRLIIDFSVGEGRKPNGTANEKERGGKNDCSYENTIEVRCLRPGEGEEKGARSQLRRGKKKENGKCPEGKKREEKSTALEKGRKSSEWREKGFDISGKKKQAEGAIHSRREKGRRARIQPLS